LLAYKLTKAISSSYIHYQLLAQFVIIRTLDDFTKESEGNPSCNAPKYDTKNESMYTIILDTCITNEHFCTTESPTSPKICGYTIKKRRKRPCSATQDLNPINFNNN